MPRGGEIRGRVSTPPRVSPGSKNPSFPPQQGREESSARKRRRRRRRQIEARREEEISELLSRGREKKKCHNLPNLS